MFIRVYNFRRIKKYVLFSTLILLLCVTLAFIIKSSNNRITSDAIETYASTGRVIIIDAGHGGEDPGAIGINGILEKDINLSIALLIGEELKNRGYTVLFTRTSDRMLYSDEENVKGMRKISDLKNRCRLTHGYPDSVFISIHMNTFGSSKYSGLQVYYRDGDKESMALANRIQSSVKKELQQSNNRQIKNGKDIYLLENSYSTSVLVECGFLSNEAECKKLCEKEYQKELSFSIICGIIDYIREEEQTD